MTSNIKQWRDVGISQWCTKFKYIFMLPLRLQCPSSSSTPHTAPYLSSLQPQSVRPRTHTPAKPSAVHRSRDSVSPSASFPSQRLWPPRKPDPMLALLIEPFTHSASSIAGRIYSHTSTFKPQPKKPREREREKHTISHDQSNAPTDPHPAVHQHLLPLRPLLLDQIARRAENGEQVLGRPVVLVEPRRHDAHV